MKKSIAFMDVARFSFVMLIGVIAIANSFSVLAVNHGPRAKGAETLILRCINQCDQVAKDVESLGGKVTVRFINVNALAVQVTSALLDQVAALKGVSKFVKDRQIPLPRPVTPMAVGRANNVKARVLNRTALSDLLSTRPANYNFNNQLTRATVLHQDGQLGEGVVVAVVDTGVANNEIVVPALSSSVIGGEMFVEGDDEPSATSTLNDSHGTMVSTMIAGHAAFVAPSTSDIVQSLLVHAPDSVIAISADESLVPMIGTAPAASIYAMKVFPSTSGFASSSSILAAMDRIISLRKNFNAGEPVVPVSGTGAEEDPFVYDSLNIQVANFSLGGQTLIPGLEIEDVLALEMLTNGIAVVVSTGNEGPTAMTGGSPGTSVAAISVGAANTAAHERLWLDAEVELGFGKIYRPNDETQIAYFSSRGPTADGRRGIDLVANGMGSFVQGADGGIYLVAGTSFSAPTVAGAAALLSGAQPNASAVEIRSALIKSANDDLLGGDNAKIDEGKGFLDVAEALEVLESGEARSRLPSLPRLSKRNKIVKNNIDDYEIEILDFGKGERGESRKFKTKVELRPGEVSHLAIPTGNRTGSIKISISDIEAELPLEQQNTLFGDDLFVTVVDAPTAFNDELAAEFLVDDTQLEFVDPQHGLMRVAIMGDFTNAGKIKASITIEEKRTRQKKANLKRTLADGAFDEYQLIVEPGTNSVQFGLDWNGDWGRFPTNDLDIILIDPDGNLWFDGATLRVPENVVIDSPTPGLWDVIIDGFDLHGGEDRYALRAYDGNGSKLELIQ